MTSLMLIVFGLKLFKGMMMKHFIYFLNLAIFGLFMLSIYVVSENPAPMYIFTLIASTVGLCLMFALHCETSQD